MILRAMFMQFAIMNPTLPKQLVKQSDAAKKMKENKII